MGIKKKKGNFLHTKVYEKKHLYKRSHVSETLLQYINEHKDILVIDESGFTLNNVNLSKSFWGRKGKFTAPSKKHDYPLFKWNLILLVGYKAGLVGY